MTNKTDKSEEKKSPLAPNTTFELIIGWQQAAPVYTKKLKAYAKRLKLPGFRPGMVPDTIAEKEIGTDAIIEEVLRELLPELYVATIKDRKFAPLTDPEFQAKSHLHKGEDWTIITHIAEKPEVKLGDYQKLVKEAGKQALSDWEKQEKDKKVKNSDSKKASQDQPADKADPQKTQREQKDFILNAVYTKLMEKLDLAIPELLVKVETRHQLDELTRQLKAYNLTLEQFLDKQKLSFEQYANGVAGRALTQLRLSFILDQIRSEAKISVTPEEIDQTVKKSDTQSQAHGDDKYLREAIERSLISQKLENFILELTGVKIL